MAEHALNTRTLPSWPWWRIIMTVLCALAFVLSVYLSWHHLSGGTVIGCSGGSACDQVLSSRWSTIGGIVPVSGLAMGAYLALLMASLFIGPATEAPVRRLAWGAILLLAGAAAGSAIWFIILQKWYINAFCPYCTTTHIIGLMLTALVIWQAPAHLGHRPTIGLVTGGLILSVFMAVLQITVAPAAVYVDGVSAEQTPALDPRTVPLVGSPDAQYIVTLLFDYQCTHCQELHFMLDQAVRSYDGDLAFVLRPSPLSSKCNPYMPPDTDEFNASCDLAQLGMAVWLADREAFKVFNRWMFTMDSGDYWLPRNIDAARGKAVELVGQETLDAALADPWIDQYIQNTVQTYAKTSVAVPKLAYGSRWVIPQPSNADELIMILQNSLAVPVP